MSFPKILAIVAALLFGIVAILAVWKKGKSDSPTVIVTSTAPLEIDLDAAIATTDDKIVKMPVVEEITEGLRVNVDNIALPTANRIVELFDTGVIKLPFVETVTYSSRVSWLQGRPAWIVDYASYYGTSRHFIARSLNHKLDYYSQNVHEGDRFNVFKKDKNIQFYLLVDISRCKLWFYAIDQDTQERVLLKDYVVGIGRPDARSPSKCLTPLGKYQLGHKVGIYKPGIQGSFNNQQTEMIRVFGTRWIPFDRELSKCSAPAKGYGLHGAPWVADNESGQLIEDKACIGKCMSDGCIRLTTEDMEEIFSVVITKPTVVEIVNDFFQADIFKEG